MKVKLSRTSNKKRLKQLQSWISNEMNKGKGHKRVKNQYGTYIKIKKK